jgi:hypothetical protein
MNKRSEILRTAETLVNGDRNRQYGDPKSDFRKIAALWETYLNGTHERHMEEGLPATQIFIEPHDVAVLMILLKVSRLSWSPEKEDSWADAAGYVACGWDCAAEEEDGGESDLDNDDEFQDDIAVDLDDLTEEQYALLMALFTPAPEDRGPKFGGFLGGSLFPKGPIG